jgi:hypothetical protein
MGDARMGGGRGGVGLLDSELLEAGIDARCGWLDLRIERCGRSNAEIKRIGVSRNGNQKNEKGNHGSVKYTGKQYGDRFRRQVAALVCAFF